MYNNLAKKYENYEVDLNYKKKSYTKKKSKKRQLSNLGSNMYKKIYIASILLVCFLASYNTYININCSDLYYSIEHNLTKGFPSDKRLFRIQSISIIESKNSTQIVNVSGLSKKAPHKTISIIANFKKENGIWVLKHIY